MKLLNHTFAPLFYFLIGLGFALIFSYAIFAFNAPRQGPVGDGGVLFVASNTVLVIRPVRISGTTTVETGNFGVGVTKPAGLFDRDAGARQLRAIRSDPHADADCRRADYVAAHPAPARDRSEICPATGATQRLCVLRRAGDVWGEHGLLGSRESSELAAAGPDT